MGIGTRLFLAFLGIMAVSLSSGVVSWFIFSDISQAQLRLSTQALPAVAATRRAADATAKLAAAAPALTAAKDQQERSVMEGRLSELAKEIDRSVTEASRAALDNAAFASLDRTVDLLVTNLAVQNRLVRERLVIENDFERQSQATIEAATAIVDLSETLVSNASAGASAVIANLYGLVEDPLLGTETFDALDRLIEQDIYLLDRMWELRLRSSQIALLMNRLTRAIDTSEVADIAAGSTEHLRVVRRRVASIDDPVRRAQASRFLQVLSESISASPRGQSLFSEKRRLLTIGDELNKLADDNGRLSAQVGSIAQQMLVDSEAFARDTASQADRAVGTGLYVLMVSSIAAVVFSGLIVWLYVERGVVRRLARLTGAMQRLTNGDLSVEVKQEGVRELKALSTAVRAFRDESKQRRALEVEREQTNEELRRHREQLQQLVEERTTQWQEANGLLRQEVEKHAEAREQAEIASRAKSDFLATISHEIRTPMTGVLGMVRILSDSASSEEQRRQLAVAASAGEALLGILNSILDYSKIESGMAGIDPVSFDLREILGGIVDLMRPSAEEKGLKISLTCDRKIWARHKADAGKLGQIIFNLVNNAIKFSDKGEVTIAARRVSGAGTSQTIDISVKDNGPGISPEDQSRVFEAFTQTEPSITRRFGGTGLGLTISRRFAELLGGSLRVESALGRGSTFTLTLPLARDRSPQRDPTVKLASAVHAPPMRVLVVEDDAATRMVAQTFLEQFGHRVTLAPDGYSAIDIASKAMPDLVLMDISLPGIDGAETAKRIRRLAGARHLPIVAMSAHVFKADVNRHLASGLDGYVGKPLTPEALQGAIDDACRKVGSFKRGRRIDSESFSADIIALGGETMTRILDLAEETVPVRFSMMRQHLADHALEPISSLAHATKSSATAAGFEALLESANRLEAAALDNDLQGVRRYLADCEVNYDLAMSEARGLVRSLANQDQESVVANR